MKSWGKKKSSKITIKWNQLKICVDIFSGDRVTGFKIAASNGQMFNL